VELEVAEGAGGREVRAGAGVDEHAVDRAPAILAGAPRRPAGEVAPVEERDRRAPARRGRADEGGRARAGERGPLAPGRHDGPGQPVAGEHPLEAQVAGALLPLRRDGEPHRVARDLDAAHRRALPTLPTKRPTSVREPERCTSSHDGARRRRRR
jgi:hypothetical protein